MSYEYQDFLAEYEPQFTQIKSILGYLGTYPELLAKFKLESLIEPEALDVRQQDWVPIGAKSLDLFIDLSDNEFPVFEMEFFFFEPYHYFKTFLFYKISDLLLASEQDINFNEFEEQRLASIFGQAGIYFEMRKRLS